MNFYRLLNRWKEVLIITLSIKLSLFLLTFLDLENSNQTFFNQWIRWDGPHYIDIAKYGYQTQGEEALWIVFYPLYPLLIKIFSFVFQDFPLSTIALSTVFSFLASIMLFELVVLDYKKRVGVLAVWFMNIFPTAYFLQASYTESVYLTVSLYTFYFFRKSQLENDIRLSFLSGGFGFFSSLARINGILILPALLFEIKKINQSLITFMVAPLGFITYLFINYLLFGNFLYFQKPLLENWHKKFEFPWIGVENLIKSVPPINNDLFYVFASELIALIFILVSSIFVFFKVRRSYGFYMLLNLGLFASTNFILSTPRYMLILFPIYIILGLIKNRFYIILISSVFLSLLISLTWFYLEGKWAF